MEETQRRAGLEEEGAFGWSGIVGAGRRSRDNSTYPSSSFGADNTTQEKADHSPAEDTDLVPRK